VPHRCLWCKTCIRSAEQECTGNPFALPYRVAKGTLGHSTPCRLWFVLRTSGCRSSTLQIVLNQWAARGDPGFRPTKRRSGAHRRSHRHSCPHSRALDSLPRSAANGRGPYIRPYRALRRPTAAGRATSGVAYSVGYPGEPALRRGEGSRSLRRVELTPRFRQWASVRCELLDETRMRRA
jgi:hypothetical protein